MKNFFLSLVLILTVTHTWSQGFSISGTSLIDANGNNFIMKGINVPLAWFIDDVNNNISNIRNRTGANTIRIVVSTDTSDSAWQTCVQRCIDNNMIPMVELHNVTCLDDANSLNQMAQFWASKSSFLTRPDIAKYILINIANEWGSWALATNNAVAWRNAYRTAITTMRNAGINTTLIIDAPNCGQDRNNGSTIKAYGKELQSYDPRHNLLFSVHFYGEWGFNASSNVSSGLPSIKNAGIPIIVGEFAANEGIEVNTMNTCQSNGIGWIAWSWKGNGEPYNTDMSNDWAGTSLATWGNTAVWGSNGTKTAVTASVFNQCSPTTITPAIQVNGGAWQSVNTVTVNAGTSVKLGPQPVTGGSWSWTGCGTSGTSREQTLTPTSACTATATYTNACGAKSTMAFNITINGATGCGTDANGVPYCCTNSDPDGDGWGWENNASCVVKPISTQLPNGTYTITARHSGKVLDVYNSSTANDGNVDQWTYVAGAANQKWVVENLGSDTYSIKALHSGKSLDVAGNSLVDGADINQWTYNATANQKWKIESVGSGYYRIVSVNSGKCVDVVANSTADGAAINQYTCSGTNNQSFTFQSTTATARTAAPTNKEQLSEVVKTVIYPNPSSGLFTVAHTGSFSYTINNSVGMAVEKGSGNDQAVVGKNISTPGLYILTMTSPSGAEKIKLIKN